MRMETGGNFELPACSLEESIRNLKVLQQGAEGNSCPRCGGTDFGKRGRYKYKGRNYPKKLCRDCGYIFSIIDLKKEGSTHNRAARIFNLDNKKLDNLLYDALQFGVVKKNEDGTYSKGAFKSNLDAYHKIPLYHYLIETVGNNLQRSVFESALQSNPDKTLASESKVKRDTLWRRYQEIATEIFVCEKQCKFGMTCKKVPRERTSCDIVKKARSKKRGWKVDIEL